MESNDLRHLAQIVLNANGTQRNTDKERTVQEVRYGFRELKTLVKVMTFIPTRRSVILVMMMTTQMTTTTMAVAARTCSFLWRWWV